MDGKRAADAPGKRYFWPPSAARVLLGALLALATGAGLGVHPAAAATDCAPDLGPSSVVFSIAPPTSGTAGLDLGGSFFTVRAKCADGTTTDAGWSGTIALTLDSGTFATVGTGTTSKHTTTGTASFGGPGSGLKINTAGTYIIRATATPDETFSGPTSPWVDGDLLEISAGSPDHLEFTEQPTSADAGWTLDEVAVAIRDLFGNTVAADSDTRITLTLKTSPGGVTSSFAASGDGITSWIVSAGEAFFSELVVNAAGTYRITASSDAGIGNVVSNEFTIVAGTTASKLAFSNGPITVPEKVLSGLFTLQQQDDGTNPIAVTADDVLLTIKLTSSSPGGVFWNLNGSAVLLGGCVAIPTPQSQAQFKYVDTIPGKPTITASTFDLEGCPNEPFNGLSFDDAYTAEGAVNVQVAPVLVTISGAGFGTTGAVNWGSSEIVDVCNKAIGIVNNCIKKVSDIFKFKDTSVSVVPPPGDVGASALVRVNGGNGLGTKDTTFYYGSVVTGLKTWAGPAAGGTLVAISGVGFGPYIEDTSVVNWGNASIFAKCSFTGEKSCITKWSPNSVVVSAPMGTVGSRVSVKVNAGAAVQSAAADTRFTYGSLVTGLKPQGGPAIGGTPLTISGLGFGAFVPDTSTVNWGNTPITALCTTELLSGCIKKFTEKSVIIVTPVGDAGTSVAVKVSNGNVLSTVDNRFYYGSVVTGLKPQTGVAAGGTKVTIAGVGFGTFVPGTSTVNWGSTPITVQCSTPTPLTLACISNWSPTSVRILAPDSASAPAKVAVSVNSAPVIGAIDPNFYYGSVVKGLKPQ